MDKAAKIAEYLLQIKAVKLQPDDPFTWSSGWKSPIYCDNRKILSYPEVRTFVRQELSQTIIEEYGKPDMIAGVATGAIAIGALVAQEIGIPFVYVRSSAKGHGLQNRIEGDASTGSSVVVIEDLISTGRSSIEAVEALRAADLNVKGVVSIFNYNFKTAQEAFKKANCQINTLSSYEVLIETALKENIISENNLDSLHKWRVAPDSWGK